MPAADDKFDRKLAALNNLYSEDDRQTLTQSLNEYLLDKNNRVVARAAQIIEEKLLYELEPDLRHAYQRMLLNAVKKDANCIAKSATMRCVVALDCDDVDFYLSGLHYQQREPVWGGSVDTAIDVRCSSAMGLVSTNYSRVMIELLDLLNDPEANARAGAIRAIRYGVPYEAALVLRQKIMSGDSEPEVIGECFTALLQVEPEQSLALVSQYLQHDNEQLYELAALALGQSRLEDALKELQNAWKQTFAIHQARQRVLIRSAVQHRSEAAFEWLLSLLVTGDGQLADTIMELLSIYAHNSKLRQRVEGIVKQTGNGKHQELFTKYW